MRPARHVRCAASRKPRAMWSHRIIVSNGSRTLVTSTQVPSEISHACGRGLGDNHHTCRRFAEILGLVPTGTITPEDLELVSLWLNGKFERGSVGRALDEGALTRFLESGAPDDWRKAASVLCRCTAIKWIEADDFGDGKKPTPLVDDYWLKQLIDHHAATVDAKAGAAAADCLLEIAREVFGTEVRRLDSRAYRPAIENHKQNHRWHAAENRSVDGLRDVLVGWCQHEPDSAKPFVEHLLRDDEEIVRRVGIHVLTECWGDLHDLYSGVLDPKFFQSGHLHEVYELLRRQFQEFTTEQKNATLQSIRDIQVPTRGDDPQRLLRARQLQWLQAIVGFGYPPADAWITQLKEDQAIAVPRHPDFDAYFEVSIGPGPTPYQSQELLTFTAQGVIVEKLNRFEPKRTARSPTLAALVSTLEQTVRRAPGEFLELLPDFLSAKREFQHGVVWGLKQAWDDKGDESPLVDWDRGWEKLVTFFEQLVASDAFWNEPVSEHPDLVPTRDWIPPSIAQFLESGTKSDERAFPASLLPRTWSLVQILLTRTRSTDRPADDAMTQAINSPKGRAIGALFSHALRVCRLSDESGDGHAESWEPLRPVFDAELARCTDGNYEFSTLCGAYFPQLYYIDRDWVQAERDRIFPSEFPANTICAIDGLSYAQASRPIYTVLLDKGVIDRALSLELRGKYAREKLIERIALAYLWGDEDLGSPRFSFLFDSHRTDDLESMSRFFRGVRAVSTTLRQPDSAFTVATPCWRRA